MRYLQFGLIRTRYVRLLFQQHLKQRWLEVADQIKKNDVLIKRWLAA